MFVSNLMRMRLLLGWIIIRLPGAYARVAATREAVSFRLGVSVRVLRGIPSVCHCMRVRHIVAMFVSNLMRMRLLHIPWRGSALGP